MYVEGQLKLYVGFRLLGGLMPLTPEVFKAQQ